MLIDWLPLAPRFFVGATFESIASRIEMDVIFLPEPPRELIEVIAVATVFAVVFWRRSGKR
ncbi:hypothetical protein MK489_05515 [Myxococcota bacterium]|nr:hypothetical protein [Myxococcota bacterium]